MLPASNQQNMICLSCAGRWQSADSDRVFAAIARIVANLCCLMQVFSGSLLKLVKPHPVKKREKTLKGPVYPHKTVKRTSLPVNLGTPKTQPKKLVNACAPIKTKRSSCWPAQEIQWLSVLCSSPVMKTISKLWRHVRACLA